MNKSKFSPGPWGAYQVPDRSLYHVYGGSDPLPVATVWSETGSVRGGRGGVETAANARLIAAAPELYAVLRDILPYARACIGATWLANPPHDSVIVAAEAALAKVDA